VGALDETSATVPAPAVRSLDLVEQAEGTPASPGGTQANGQNPRGERFAELDSLRGIAAATVVLCHLVTTALAAYGRQDPFWVLEHTPLHIFWAGHQAVVFFFVLSGFVLALPFYSRPVSYRAFVVKRVLRIYVPYWAAILVALLAYHWFGRQRLGGSRTWLNGWWTEPIGYRLLFDHFLLVGSFDHNALDGVIWSLVHEMRISLVFPLLMAFLLRHRWRTTLLAAAALAIVGTAINSGSSWLGHANDYGETCAYVLMFVVGALLCRHRAAVIARSRDLPALTRWACLALAILAYTYPFWALSHVHLLHLSLIDDWAVTVGVAAFIVLALSSGSAGRVLRSAPLGWLGSVSYSLYLFHAIVLIVLLKLLFGVIPPWSIWVLTIVMALILAGAGHRLLELPSIALGRRLSGPLSRGRPAGVPRPSVLADS
jgi:peptidoglycan/LPS O-acetylase OafA/YrhL